VHRPERVEPANVALLDPPGRARPPTVPKPPASRVVASVRGSSSSASGLPRASAMIRSRTALIERDRPPSSAALGRPPRPDRAPRAQAGAEAPRPAPGGEHHPHGLREQAPRHERQRQGRCLSSQCASSMRHRSGRRPRPPRRGSARQPTRKRSGGSPGAHAEHDLERLAWGAGSACRRSSSGPHSWCSPA
jgi:hypothetical protein